MLAYPARQRYLGWGQYGVGVYDAGYVPGFLNGGVFGQLQDDALQGLVAERDPYCLPHLDGEVWGYGVAECSALRYW